jgi:probable HAF family extracellular repeat protein
VYQSRLKKTSGEKSCDFLQRAAGNPFGKGNTHRSETAHMKTASTNLFDRDPKIIFLIVALVTCSAFSEAPAQGLRHDLAAPSLDGTGFRDPQRAQTLNGARKGHIDGFRRMNREHVDPDRDHLTTIPHWTAQFSWHGITYPYTMVGTDPQNGSATTVVPTLIVPLRFVFADGSVVDSSKDLIDGQTAIHGIINSPIFQPYPFISGGIHVGNTQCADAFQRANFWNYISTRASDYHVLLSQPTVPPVQTINVPADKGGYVQDPIFGTSTITAVVDIDFMEQQRKALISQLGITARSLPIFVTGTVLPTAAAYHVTDYVSSKGNSIAGAQTSVVTCYQSQTSFDGRFPDIYALSHELNEWLSDPFTNNFTPGWNIPSYSSLQCDSGGDGALGDTRDLMEVCDPLETSADSNHALPAHAFTYHVADRVFLDFFTRNPRSRSVNGQFSFFGGAIAPSTDCTGHLQITYNNISFPNSAGTETFGISNRGQVVGIYADAVGNTHGFLTDGKKFTTIDYPGAVGTNVLKINDAGLMVGPYLGADGQDHSFSYQNGRFTAIDFPGAVSTDANGVNSSGDVVGQYTDGSGLTHGFTLSHGKYQRSDAPSYANTALTFVNDFGLMSGYSYNDPVNGPYIGFIKNGKNFTPFRYPGATYVEPNCINNWGSLTGIFFNDDGYVDGFTTVFGYPYEIYGGVYGINDLGQIVGAATNSDGVVVGFTAQLPQ